MGLDVIGMLKYNKQMYDIVTKISFRIDVSLVHAIMVE